RVLPDAEGSADEGPGRRSGADHQQAAQRPDRNDRPVLPQGVRALRGRAGNELDKRRPLTTKRIPMTTDDPTGTPRGGTMTTPDVPAERDELPSVNDLREWAGRWLDEHRAEAAQSRR